MRRKRNSNRAIDLYRDSNTYLSNLFVEFEFVPINMHCFLNFKKKSDEAQSIISKQ